MKPSEVLRKAAKHLDEVGWLTGWTGIDRHGHCISGTIHCVMRNLYHSGAYVGSRRLALVLEEIYKVAREQYSISDQVTIPSINDHVIRSKQEAISLLEKAAVQLEEQGL